MFFIKLRNVLKPITSPNLLISSILLTLPYSNYQIIVIEDNNIIKLNSYFITQRCWHMKGAPLVGRFLGKCFEVGTYGPFI